MRQKDVTDTPIEAIGMWNGRGNMDVGCGVCGKSRGAVVDGHEDKTDKRNKLYQTQEVRAIKVDTVQQ